MDFRISDTFTDTDSLAKLTGEEQKVIESIKIGDKKDIVDFIRKVGLVQFE